MQFPIPISQLLFFSPLKVLRFIVNLMVFDRSDTNLENLTQDKYTHNQEN